jgi:hypothetical protein
MNARNEMWAEFFVWIGLAGITPLRIGIETLGAEVAGRF